MNKRLVIFRGLPGVGKTWAANELCLNNGYPVDNVCSSDRFHEVNGRYVFDSSKMGEAIAYCQMKVFRAMAEGHELVVVDNTHTRKHEYALYWCFAREFGYDVRVRDLYDGGMTDEQLFARNVHGVPLEKIKQMRERYER